MAEFRLFPAAERDLKGVWRYTRDEWGLEQADQYIDLLTTTVQALAQAPKSAPACEHIRKGYRRRRIGRRMIYSLGFEGANVVQDVFGATRGDFDTSVSELTRRLTTHARIGEEVGNTVAASTGWTFVGVDPTPAVGGCVDWRRDRAVYRPEVWRERHDDSRTRNYIGGEGSESKAGRLFRFDATSDGRQAARSAVG